MKNIKFPKIKRQILSQVKASANLLIHKKQNMRHNTMF